MMDNMFSLNNICLLIQWLVDTFKKREKTNGNGQKMRATPYKRAENAMNIMLNLGIKKEQNPL